MFKVVLKQHFAIFKTLKEIFTGKRKLKDCFNTAPMDITFFALVIAVLSVGLVMMFSASYIYAWYDKTANYDPLYYIKRQLVFAVIGVALMILVSYIKPEILRDASGLVMTVALLLLVLVLIFPHEVDGKEQFKRWLEVPGTSITFQPSEIAKIALIMFMAFSMEKYRKVVEKKFWVIIPYGLIVGLVCLLVILENHVSGTILILGIGASMMFFGGLRKELFWVLGAVAVVGIIVFIFFSEDILKGYAFERIRIWLKLLNGQDLTTEEARGSGWQSLQSLYAIGSGGLFGLGFGNSKQKHMYLPEPQNDFVFAVVCEELGFIGAVLIILLFIILVGRGFIIGLRSKTKYGAMLALGISFQIGLQAALNIAVVTSTAPNTGISLPFFSYGGTSLVMLLIEMGMVLAVSRNGENGERKKVKDGK